MYLILGEGREVVAVSDHRPRGAAGESYVRVKGLSAARAEFLLGRRVDGGGAVVVQQPKATGQMRVAVVCNWNDRCGISTYSKFLVDALRPKVGALRVFSEVAAETTAPDEEFVERCWRRGERLKDMTKRVLEWKPDFVIIQHEFGIFPNATHYFQMLQMLDAVPHAVVMHSVYDHLDKAVYASVSRDIVVHTQAGADCLRSKGTASRLHVIPHGCVAVPDRSELWNILRTPYTVVQFGFGFRYKGVERMLDAVAKLKAGDPAKYGDLFYAYFLSTNQHNDRAHDDYYASLMARVAELGLEDNVAIVRRFNTDAMLSLYLRIFKLAVFPYVVSPDNTVFGASGAVRLAMAHGIPVVASESHLFDDLEGVLPRPADADALSAAIDKVFSDGEHRRRLTEGALAYVHGNGWDVTADRYIDVYRSIVPHFHSGR